MGPIDELLFPEEEDPDEEPEATPASGCPAKILEESSKKGEFSRSEIATDVSAPFFIELKLRP